MTRNPFSILDVEDGWEDVESWEITDVVSEAKLEAVQSLQKRSLRQPKVTILSVRQ